MKELPKDIDQVVTLALKEDIGDGDVSARLVPANTRANAHVISREDGIICGLAWFERSFTQIDSEVRIDWQVNDGNGISAGQTLCTISGNARALLTAERTALNFLQTLSATATRAKLYVDAVAGTQCKILDTRKTLPGLRTAQKYATRCGGALNHRMGLFDAILIKENHILAAGSIRAAVHKAKKLFPELMIEVEIEHLNQLEEAVNAGAQRLLLDNMNTTTLRQAVKLAASKVELEASGGVQLDNIKDIALTGVDFISVGALTKNVTAIDLSMRFDFL